MQNEDLHDEEKNATSGSALKGRHLIIIAVAAVVVGTALYLWNQSRRAAKTEQLGASVVAPVPEGSRTVTLYFGDVADEGLVSETRQVAIGRGFVEQIQQVVGALIAGPERKAVNTIPEGTRLLNVFYDADESILYLDFSAEFVAGHPGGSAAEYFTVSAIIKTVSENFPEVRAVQILVEGSQVSSIAGHVDAYRPLFVRDWR